ncbi:unnamed protein product [Vitrella brassicaformis CCMP3155]|uniref:Uncharacterized protein n=1 Tax=Vitrella brassicaformis (strain CCMP3155) TaxID=1169540 RepID=A0A0G4H507_VITBC|nr:unnamed protein product [Vitrella brassicaformis CCMP3155]|eukprot:CEM38877.1 unnamed protein product [Vitrella brassicaformis CCMP3155]
MRGAAAASMAFLAKFQERWAREAAGEEVDKDAWREESWLAARATAEEAERSFDKTKANTKTKAPPHQCQWRHEGRLAGHKEGRERHCVQLGRRQHGNTVDVTATARPTEEDPAAAKKDIPPATRTRGAAPHPPPAQPPPTMATTAKSAATEATKKPPAKPTKAAAQPPPTKATPHTAPTQPPPTKATTTICPYCGFALRACGACWIFFHAMDSITGAVQLVHGSWLVPWPMCVCPT